MAGSGRGHDSGIGARRRWWTRVAVAAVRRRCPPRWWTTTVAVAVTGARCHWQWRDSGPRCPRATGCSRCGRHCRRRHCVSRTMKRPTTSVDGGAGCDCWPEARRRRGRRSCPSWRRCCWPGSSTCTIASSIDGYLRCRRCTSTRRWECSERWCSWWSWRRPWRAVVVHVALTLALALTLTLLLLMLMLMLMMLALTASLSSGSKRLGTAMEGRRQRRTR